MKRLPVIVAAAAFLATGCSGATATSPSPSPSPAVFDVRGTLTLNQVSLNTAEGEECAGSGGYDDIRAGTQVKVSDSTGRVVGLGALWNGTAADPLLDTGATSKCLFDFTVSRIPVDSGEIFGVEVSHRGVIQFTRDQADSISLTLGS